VEGEIKDSNSLRHSLPLAEGTINLHNMKNKAFFSLHFQNVIDNSIAVVACIERNQ